MSRRFPIRAKLTVGALLPLLVALAICSLAGLYIISAKVASQAQDKVRTDLNAAREAYNNELHHIAAMVELTAASPYAATAIERGDRQAIATLISPLEQRQHPDMLAVVDFAGRVLYRAHNPSRFGDRPAVPFLDQALHGKTVAGTTVFSPEQLAAEKSELADRANIAIVATPRARPRQERAERAGMLMVAAAPVRDARGRVVGALYGAELLNNSNALVDRIKDTVYEGVRFDGQELGTATLFLGDTRIATNVLTSSGERAIGTRLSAEVYDRVLVQKEKWVGRAFVVNDWYFTAYQPILDLEGKAIGSLYVGMLEKPYRALKRNVNTILWLVLLFSSTIGIVVSGMIGLRLARPIRELERLARSVAAGERDLRIEVRSGDELEDLANEFNQMTGALAQREEEINRLHQGLEEKVRERTAQLEEKSRQLLETQADLAQAEKLADLGVMAAGVAHEINNPLAIIRGNTEVLEMCIPADHPNREEIDIISRQTERMARIVGNLLVFARQKKLHRGQLLLHGLLDDIVAQLGHQVSLEAVSVVRQYDPAISTIRGDADQLRQVFTNIILNAVQAMPGGGVLTLSTGLTHAREWEVVVADTGPGIVPEHLEKIFSPFFTTREKGSGLGLSVSYGIVKDHGGEIRVENRAEGGALFRIILPQGEPAAEG